MQITDVAISVSCEVHTTTNALLDAANLLVSCEIGNCEYFEVLRQPAKTGLPSEGSRRCDGYEIETEVFAGCGQKR